MTPEKKLFYKAMKKINEKKNELKSEIQKGDDYRYNVAYLYAELKGLEEAYSYVTDSLAELFEEECMNETN